MKVGGYRREWIEVRWKMVGKKDRRIDRGRIKDE
jgi:hypothetical protein